jgi:hypothetical protein
LCSHIKECSIACSIRLKIIIEKYNIKPIAIFENLHYIGAKTLAYNYLKPFFLPPSSPTPPLRKNCRFFLMAPLPPLVILKKPTKFKGVRTPAINFCFGPNSKGKSRVASAIKIKEKGRQGRAGKNNTSCNIVQKNYT